VRPAAYPRVEHLKGASFRKVPDLPAKTKLERLARGKHSSLLQKSINYGSKKFFRIGSKTYSILISCYLSGSLFSVGS